jgi:Icc-related predicted phosphoesterase
MRLLHATDIHASPQARELILRTIDERSPDLFVAGGDLTNFGPLEYAADLLGRVPVRTLAVPGNCDPRGLVDLLEELGVNLHGKRTRVEGRAFVGLGGSNPTPFGTPFELSEEEIEALLSPVLQAGDVLVSHPPPRGIVDVVHGGAHVGSVAVARLVEARRPSLVLCGHIHEARGMVTEPTVVVNSGAAAQGHLSVVDLGDAIRVDMR